MQYAKTIDIRANPVIEVYGIIPVDGVIIVIIVN
jgi:hypothetical protein